MHAKRDFAVGVVAVSAFAFVFYVYFVRKLSLHAVPYDGLQSGCEALERSRNPKSDAYYSHKYKGMLILACPMVL